MRPILALVVVVLVTSMLATPALTLGQSAETDGEALPLARRPDGLLPLEGTPWRLRWYRWKGSEREPGPEVAARMTLTAGGLEASGGCTAFTGSYGTVGRAIDFQLRKLKDNDCGEQTTMVQLAMVDGLKDAAHYEIDDSDGAARLALFDQAGTELLRFGLDDVGGFTTALGSSEWSLVAYHVDGANLVADPDATPNLLLSPDRSNQARRRASGSVLGSTGCNGFMGEFFLHANVASFGELQVTDAPCAASTARQQAAILDVFEATAIEITFPPDQMIMSSADSGTSLEYRAVPALQGSTWIRSSAGGDDPVTLRLESGTASGEGPCGAYGATYVTDGVFITFTDVHGADDGTCPAAKDERKLLKALRSTVYLDREPGKKASPPRLTLRDARGSTLVRFESPFGRAP